MSNNIRDTAPSNIDFDNYVDSYEDFLQKQTLFFSNDSSYFSTYKVEIVAKKIKQPPMQILDFGCGIGLSLPPLTTYFPTSKLYATDISKKSLTYVKNTYPSVTILYDDDIQNYHFDLIFIACVFHHISASVRSTVIKRLEALLNPSGTICIFEHNPYNPITRKIVSECPFDKDIELIAPYKMKKLILQETALHIHKTGYCLFFPPALSYLKPLEKGLSWLPLGGQYFVIANKV